MFMSQQKLQPKCFFIFPVRGFCVKITHNRESMKSIARFLLVALSLVPVDTALAVVASTRGDNLTAYNGNSGAVNNNTWNTLMNSRTSAVGEAATADFGNCNAIVLRCAQPKCASGGCTDMTVATSIVDGCVRSNEACQQYGSDLVSYIAAQLVANSTAKVNAQTAAAQTAAANAAAQQNAQQLQAMQAQMQQMQQTMVQQNAETVAQLQSALAQQQEQFAAAQSASQPAASSASDNTDAVPDNGLTVAQNAAAAAGVSADTLAREQITGQIYEKIENSETQMKALKTTMQDAFTYAGCDTSGNNCTGPHRVKAFKQRAMNFFEPYNAVLDEVYDALILAQSVGVDISDIYMMLNGTCNAWAQYMCSAGQVMHYTADNCGTDGVSIAKSKVLRTKTDGGEEVYLRNTGVLGNNKSCRVGQVVPMSDGGCQLVRMLTSTEEVRREWLNIAEGDESQSIRVGCASEALDNSTLFRNRKKQATIDIETLERIIEQDAPATFTGTKTPENNGIIFCNVGEKLQDLQKHATLKTIPAKLCAKLDATGTSLSPDTNATTCDYILPEYAMCTTHVYNVGKTENSSVAAEKQEMKDVIALKTTIMTQQIKAQYDYLDATMRRLKTQLEKAILTTKLQAAGAGTTSDGGTSISGNTGDTNIYLAGTQNCNNMNTTAEVFTCLRSNYNLIYNMSNGGTNITTELRKQLANDVGVVVSNAGGAGLTPNNSSGSQNSNNRNNVLSGLPNVTVDNQTVDCSVVRQVQGRNAFQKCLAQLNIEIRNATSNLNSRQQQQNQNNLR